MCIRDRLNPYEQKHLIAEAAENTELYTSEEKQQQIEKLTKAMEKAAKNLDFIQAASLRDQINALKM